MTYPTHMLQPLAAWFIVALPWTEDALYSVLSREPGFLVFWTLSKVRFIPIKDTKLLLSMYIMFVFPFIS